jgi:hypothetical protein
MITHGKQKHYLTLAGLLMSSSLTAMTAAKTYTQLTKRAQP